MFPGSFFDSSQVYTQTPSTAEPWSILLSLPTSLSRLEERLSECLETGVSASVELVTVGEVLVRDGCGSRHVCLWIFG